ncbi:MAG: DUF6526 family protein [Gemmatimonadota bacterium]|nr:DUF6526 family protein [Gemmatimonadota bacterium]
MSQSPQNFANHAKLVPGFHYVLLPLVMVLVGWAGYNAFSSRTGESHIILLMAVALFIMGWYVRTFPLGVQDRVIRLEEHLRMARVLPEDLKGRVGELTTDQLVGLRFASDEELADLTRRVLGGEFADRKAIKAAVKNWRADHERI